MTFTLCLSSINPLTGEAAQCVTIAGPDGVNTVGASKFSPQSSPQSQRPLVQTPKRPLRPPPPDSSYTETVSIQEPGKFTVVFEKPYAPAPKRPLRPSNPDNDGGSSATGSPRKKVDTFQTKIVPRKPFAPSDVKTNPQRLTGDATDLIVGNKKPDRFSVPRKSNMPDKPERTEKFGDIENLKNRRPGSLNDDIAASYAYPYVFGSPYTFGYQPRVIHAPIW